MNRLLGQRVYVDANAIIYFAEMHPTFGEPMRAGFQMARQGEATLVTSELPLAEVLVLPIKANRQDLVAAYTGLISHRDSFEVISVSRSILVESANRRASAGIKLPDAIHVATAIIANCRIFISEDRNIRTPQRLEHVKISLLDRDLPTSSTQ